MHQDEYTVAGKHMRVFDPQEYELSPGSYYFSLENGKEVIKKKMIFVK
jgi:hypothetical protein